MAEALRDLEMAMWADPSFAVAGICADAGLSCVLDAAFDFASAQAQTNCA